MEALFPIICKKNNLTNIQPIELSEIHYQKKHDILNNTFIYHPVKDITMHKIIRDKTI